MCGGILLGGLSDCEELVGVTLREWWGVIHCEWHQRNFLMYQRFYCPKKFRCPKMWGWFQKNLQSRIYC